MQKKRIKSGLAVTEQHLQLVDDNLRKAKVKSRNDFVEKAIEYYAGCLNAEQNREYMGGVLSADLEKLFSKFGRTFSTNQYKLSVQVAVLCHLIAGQYGYNSEKLKNLMELCAEEVKALDSVPNFGKILKIVNEEKWGQGGTDY